jgi:ankyrin repeat protein
MVGCQNGSFAFIFKLLKHRDINVYIIDKAGHTAFHYLFLNLEPSTNPTRDHRQYRMRGVIDMFGEPLLNNHNSIIKVLQLFYHKYPEAIRFHDNEGRNVIHSFSKEIRWPNDYLDFIFNWVRDLVNEKDINGCTPLHYAINRFNDFCFYKLINMTIIDVNIKDNVGQTALHYYCKRPTPDRIELLIGHPTTKTYSTDDHGNTALHTLFVEMTEYGHGYDALIFNLHSYELIATKIIEANKFVTLIKNNEGKTALEEAHKKRNQFLNIELETLKNDVDKCISILEKNANDIRMIMFTYFNSKYVVE